MANLKVGTKAFVRSYRQRTRRVEGLARRFSDSPSPEEVHDLRVAARRAQVLFRLLPKELRKSKSSEEFAVAIASLLANTSRIRDLDTLTLTLEQPGEDLPAELFRTLSRERTVSLGRARRAVALASEASPPAVDGELDGKRISRRLRRRVKRRREAIAGLLPVVLNDESKVKELHSLRREAKKLRYLLELADSPPPELGELARWQEALGSVHDLDVAVEYLGHARLAPPVKAVARLRRERNEAYVRFKKGCKPGRGFTSSA